MTVMCRVGGYSSLNVGKAWFDDVEVVRDTIDTIFDCTSSGGLGGLGDIMEGAEGMPGVSVAPGVSVETHVIGL